MTPGPLLFFSFHKSSPSNAEDNIALCRTDTLAMLASPFAIIVCSVFLEEGGGCGGVNRAACVS